MISDFYFSRSNYLSKRYMWTFMGAIIIRKAILRSLRILNNIQICSPWSGSLPFVGNIQPNKSRDSNPKFFKIKS
ncbi:unnamed protein product [Hermetia illucens]|uniref:Uncharacterized protein n=1 Tax=Hermetia illucens TaxID=343691 RepID=A0A7R8UF46_HERIL|nr:unnamed protein product [Hermetia illucens]